MQLRERTSPTTAVAQGAARAASTTNGRATVRHAGPRTNGSDSACWAGIQAVSSRVGRACDVPDLLDAIIGSALEAVGWDAGLIILADPTDGRPTVAASRGLTESIECLVSSFGALGSEIVRSGRRPISLDEHDDLPDADLLAFALRDAGFRALLATPLLRRDGRPLGTMVTLGRCAQTTDDRTVGLLDLLGRQASDAVERQHALVQLARERTNLRAIVDNVSEAIIVVDASGRILAANPAVLDMFGHAPDQLVGSDISIVVDPSFTMTKAPASGDRRNGSAKRTPRPAVACVARRRDGSDLFVELTTSAVDDLGGRVLLFRDITRRREDESRQRQSDRLAVLGTLAAGLGHDMNNMLFPIRAHLNGIASRAAQSADAPNALAVAEVFRGIEYLQQLADGLHYLVQDDGGPEAAASEARLDEWWSSTGALLGRSLPPLSVVEAVFPASMPPVRICAASLTQVVLNLFVNSAEAISARADGTRGLVRVEASLSAEGHEVRISVSDNGMGMPESVRSRAMDMFFTTKTRAIGTGLGLALVARVIDAAGGRVAIESKVGHGTVVSLFVPVARLEAAPEFRVAVRLKDGRASDLLAGLLRGRGFREVSADGEERADAWIVEHGAVPPAAAAEWLAARMGRSVLVFGSPGPVHAEWACLGAECVGEADGFDALLAGADRVCDSLLRRTGNA